MKYGSLFQVPFEYAPVLTLLVEINVSDKRKCWNREPGCQALYSLLLVYFVSLSISYSVA